MKQPPLIPAVLVRRYKRFLADVILADGQQITVYCPNTGAMTGCADPGSRVWLSQSNNPKRKYQYTWELVETGEGHRVCVHSALANKITEEAIENGFVKELQCYSTLKKEVKYGAEKSRIDILLENEMEKCFIEVKSVTLLEQRDDNTAIGFFPDAVSERGSRHLRELIHMVEQGHRAVLLFCVLHTGIKSVAPAYHIDSVYAVTLKEAIKAGVEVLVYGADISKEKIEIVRGLTFNASV